jgi:hypothetical protein
VKPLAPAGVVAAQLGTAAVLVGALAASGGCGGSSSAGRTATTSSSGRGTSRAPAGAPALAGEPGAVTATVGATRASMHAGTHSPRAGRPWPVRFAVTSAGRAARASVAYEFLLAGQVVARRSHYTFDGHFSDVVVWPASAIGYPLTFRAVVAAGARTVNLDYPVRVTR